MKWATAIMGATLLIAVPSTAQDAIMALNPTTMVGYSGVVAAGQYAQRRVGTRLTQRQPARTDVSPAQLTARTSFRPDAAVRKQVYARTVARAREISPADAAKLQQLLASGKFRAEAARYLARYGMSPNNVADATAMYLASAWFASRGDNGDPTSAQMAGLRRQVALAMANTSEMATASDAIKQEVAEASLLQAMFSGSLAAEAARNPAASGQYRAAAVRGVKASYQIDLSRMDLTARGLW